MVHVIYGVLRNLPIGDRPPDTTMFDTLASGNWRERVLRQAGMAEVATEPFTWTYVFPGTDAVLRFLAAPPFGSAIAGIDEAELAEVHRQVIAGLARFRRSDGSYHVPQECHLFWGRR